MLTRRIELFISGALGLCVAYFMPEIASSLVGFEGVKVLPGFLTDMTNLVMVVARFCCAIYAISLIVSGVQKRTEF